MEKAAGADAHTVAEVYAQRMALKGQTATVRGKVVKVTSGVLGRNWLHLRDGSGSEGTQDFDLIVTTTATAQVDDVVNVQGPVVVDKDLGIQTPLWTMGAHLLFGALLGAFYSPSARFW